MGYKMKITKYSVYAPEGLIFLLPGRGMKSEIMLNNFNSYFKKYILYGIDPEVEFYPIPKGLNNQVDSVKGVKLSASNLATLIECKSKELNIPFSKIGLI